MKTRVKFTDNDPHGAYVKNETANVDAVNRLYEKLMSHPLVKALDEETYWVYPCDGGYCLYDRRRKTERANALFLGRFYISTNGNRYVFNNNYYDSSDEMVEAMDKYNETLPFSTDIYDPTMRKNYQIELAIHDYLIDIGFKKVPFNKRRTQYDQEYEISDSYGHHLITLSLHTEFDSSKGSLRRLINTDTFQEAPFNDLDSAVAAANSILAGYFTVVQAQMTNALNKLTSARAALVLDRHFDWKSLSLYSEEATQKVIESLELELKRLKGE